VKKKFIIRNILFIILINEEKALAGAISPKIQLLQMYLQIIQNTI